MRRGKKGKRKKQRLQESSVEERRCRCRLEDRAIAGDHASEISEKKVRKKISIGGTTISRDRDDLQVIQVTVRTSYEPCWSAQIGLCDLGRGLSLKAEIRTNGEKWATSRNILRSESS